MVFGGPLGMLHPPAGMPAAGGEAEEQTDKHAQEGKGKGCCRLQSSVKRPLYVSTAGQSMPRRRCSAAYMS